MSTKGSSDTVTVFKLIAMLSKFDPDTPVVCVRGTEGWKDAYWTEPEPVLYHNQDPAIAECLQAEDIRTKSGKRAVKVILL